MIYFEDIAPDIQSPASIQIHPLGDMIIGDNFTNSIFRIDLNTGQVIQSSTQTYDVTLSNPASIYANQLFILVLDVDNQAIFRFDNQLRPTAVITEDQLRVYLDFSHLIYQVLDNQNNLYLLDGVNFEIFKLDPSLKFLFSFGGLQDSNLEFKQIKEFHPLGKNEFLTYDEQKKQFFLFDITGQKTGEFSLKLDQVIDFTSNQSGYWIVLGTLKDQIVAIFGKSNQPEQQKFLFELKDKHIIDVAMHPLRQSVYVLFQEGIYTFESDQ
jgi:hypothetical protein